MSLSGFHWVLYKSIYDLLLLLLQSDEFYVCIFATRAGNTVYFYHEGGVDIGDVDSKAEKVDVDIIGTLTEEQANFLVSKVPEDKKRWAQTNLFCTFRQFMSCSVLVKYLLMLYKAYCELYFTYLEVNPLGEFCSVTCCHMIVLTHSGVRWKGAHVGSCR